MSPLFLPYVKRSGSRACPESVGSLARSVRSTVTLFTPENVGAMLHDAACEDSSLRLWQGFLGQRHIIVTSWFRQQAHQVDLKEVQFPLDMLLQ